MHQNLCKIRIKRCYIINIISQYLRLNGQTLLVFILHHSPLNFLGNVEYCKHTKQLKSDLNNTLNFSDKYFHPQIIFFKTFCKKVLGTNYINEFLKGPLFLTTKGPAGILQDKKKLNTPDYTWVSQVLSSQLNCPCIKG